MLATEHVLSTGALAGNVATLTRGQQSANSSAVQAIKQSPDASCGHGQDDTIVQSHKDLLL